MLLLDMRTCGLLDSMSFGFINYSAFAISCTSAQIKFHQTSSLLYGLFHQTNHKTCSSSLLIHQLLQHEAQHENDAIANLGRAHIKQRLILFCTFNSVSFRVRLLTFLFTLDSRLCAHMEQHSNEHCREIY